MTTSRLLNRCCLTALTLLAGLGVASGQSMGVSPQALSFVYQVSGTYPAAQSLFVTGDAGASFTVSVSGAPWITVSPTSGVVPSTLIVTATPPPGVTPGTLSGSIIIGPPASVSAAKLVVSVSLQVLAQAPGNLIVSPSSIVFDYRVGGPNPSPIAISITSTGGATAFTLTASTPSGIPWLAVTTNNPVTPATAFAAATPPSGMGPGIYYGTISVIPASGGGAAQNVGVTLRVNSGGSLVASPTYLTFDYQTGTPFPSPQVVNVVNSGGGVSTFNVTAATSSGGAWIVYSPAAGSTPSSVVVSVNPGALGPGTYSGILNIIPVPSGPQTQIPVTLRIYGYSQLVASPSSLTFNYQAGAANPLTQYVSVTTTGAPVNFVANIAGPPWITISAASGTTPTGIAVVVNPPANTVAGAYNASITLTPVGTGGNAVFIPVTVTVTSANYLAVGSSSVSFNATAGSTSPNTEVVPITSSSGSIRFQAVASAPGNSAWLTVSQSNSYTPANIVISASAQGLSAGTYQGTVTITSDQASNSPLYVSVTLTVTQGSSFTATPVGLVFSYQIGGPVPPLQSLIVSGQSNPQAFTLSAETASGGGWLLAAGGGTTPATVAAAIATGMPLTTGTYTGSLVITPTDPSGLPLRIPVILNVAPGPVYIPGVNQISFQYETAGPVPAAQKVTINATNGAAVFFYYTSQTADGGQWLKATPPSAVSPSDLTVSVDPTGLTPGVYWGLIGVNSSSGAPPTSFVPVSLQVSSGQLLTVPFQSFVFSAQVGGAVTSQQTVTVKGTGGGSNFLVKTYGGSWLQVSPTSGTTTATLNVWADPTSLPAGYYLGVVSIEIQGIPGTEQYLPVVFAVQ
jgi:hypothetical protein